MRVKNLSRLMEVKEERMKKKSIEEEQLAKARRLISKFN
jgi:hypothetical protein